MSKLVRHVHPNTRFIWAPIADCAPDIQAQGDDGQPITHALVFTSPDGSETHVFLLDNNGRDRLRSMMTGIQVVSGVVPEMRNLPPRQLNGADG